MDAHPTSTAAERYDVSSLGSESRGHQHFGSASRLLFYARMKLSLIAAAAMLAGGCASTVPAPNDSLASAIDTMRSANALGPSAEAQDHTRRAKAEIDRAVALMHEGKNEEAR